MEDVLTEAPPPSRFSEDDLDNFASPDPYLPSPFLISNPNPSPNRNPSLLVVFLISPSPLSLPSKTLTASLFLPELPLSIPRNSPISIYSLDSKPSLLIADASACHVTAARSKAVAKILIKEFAAERIVVIDSIKGENYRGRLLEEGAAFKVETVQERRWGEGFRGVERLAAGSLLEGMAAAVMGECEMRRRRGAVVVTWPETGKEVARVLKAVMRDLGIEVEEREEGALKTGSGSWNNCDLYT